MAQDITQGSGWCVAWQSDGTLATSRYPDLDASWPNYEQQYAASYTAHEASSPFVAYEDTIGQVTRLILKWFTRSTRGVY